MRFDHNSKSIFSNSAIPCYFIHGITSLLDLIYSDALAFQVEKEFSLNLHITEDNQLRLNFTEEESTFCYQEHVIFGSDHLPCLQ